MEFDSDHGMVDVWGTFPGTWLHDAHLWGFTRITPPGVQSRRVSCPPAVRVRSLSLLPACLPLLPGGGWCERVGVRNP